MSCCFLVLFKQKTAYEMRISDWSSDVCSSDLQRRHRLARDLALAGEDVDRMIVQRVQRRGGRRRHPGGVRARLRMADLRFEHRAHQEIGRATCRESVCQYV